MNGVTYFNRRAMSFNEGGTPFNFHIRWTDGFFFYLYFFGKSFSWGNEMTLPHHKRPFIVNIDAVVFHVVTLLSVLALGYWWGYESRTEIQVIKIPEKVTPLCLTPSKVRQLINDTRRVYR